MSTVRAMKAKVFENRGLSWKAKMQVYNGGANDDIWV